MDETESYFGLLWKTTISEPIQPYLEEQRIRVDQELDSLLPEAAGYPPSIHQAMRHSVFAGGKRLRPILCLESGRLFGGDEAALLRAGLRSGDDSYLFTHSRRPSGAR